MPNDRRGAAARREMGPKGYLMAGELAAKLTEELSEERDGKPVTVAMLRSYLARGKIDGIFHKGSNLWLYRADTKLPERMPRGPRARARSKAVVEQPMVLGGWARWPAPGYVRMGQKSYRVSGRESLGWLGG